MPRQSGFHRYAPKIIALAVTLAVAAPVAVAARNGHLRHLADGMVYALNNEASSNRVVTFERGSDGSLTPGRTFKTGGAGSGTTLGTQGALALSDSGHWLLAVNPGSDNVSVFLAFGDFLFRTDIEDSGGTRPVSVAINNDIVYVLNAAATGDSLQGYRLSISGKLTAIPGSARQLSSSGTGAAQVSFNRAGDLLAVTEKGTSKVLTWAVDGDGLLGDASVNDSPTPTPFGFEFGRRDQMIVSEADRGSIGGSAVSSYQVNGDGSASLITASLPNNQSANCWVVVTREGQFAFTSNTKSDNVSTYGVADDGQLSLIQAVSGLTDHIPLDLALDRSDRHLYSLNGGSGTITAFAVGSDGSLQLVENQESHRLGTASSGLVAR